MDKIGPSDSLERLEGALSFIELTTSRNPETISWKGRNNVCAAPAITPRRLVINPEIISTGLEITPKNTSAKLNIREA